MTGYILKKPIVRVPRKSPYRNNNQMRRNRCNVGLFEITWGNKAETSSNSKTACDSKKQFFMAHLKPGKKEVNRTESFLKDIKNSFRHYKLDNSIEERHRLAPRINFAKKIKLK